MRKNIVGDWGSALGDGDYACALAALGVLEASGTRQHGPTSDPDEVAKALEREFASGKKTPTWRCALRNAVSNPTGRLAWLDTVHTDAAALASGWLRYRSLVSHSREAPRLALPLVFRDLPDLFAFDDLYDWLTHPDTQVAAVVVNDGAWQDPPAWHWPLRIGIPDGPQHSAIVAALDEAQQDHGWIESLTRWFTVGNARDVCDVLILTPDAIPGILQSKRSRLRASCVICLEGPTRPSDTSGDSVALRERLYAAGVAAVSPLHHRAGELGRWFTELVREVSHDVPIHVAVTMAGKALGRDLLILGNPDALDRCRILSIAERQDRIIAGLLRAPKLDLGADEGVLGEPKFGGSAELRDVSEEKASSSAGLTPGFARELRERMFTSESVDGVRVAEDFAQREQGIEQIRRPRWIQANAWRSDGKSASSLASGAWNLIAVHIGPTDEYRADNPFPDSRVGFQGESVVVTAQLEIAGAVVRPLTDSSPADTMRELAWMLESLSQPELDDGSNMVGLASLEMLLPPTGDSPVAPFAVFPQRRFSTIEGRIAIIHNNRVLQTARVSVSVGREAHRGQPINVIAETSVHPPDDLEERRQYDAAILVSDLGGKLHLTVQRDGAVTPVQLDNLEEPISAIRKALKIAAEEWDYSKPMLEQSVFTTTMYTLASHGSALKQHLRKTCGTAVDEWERIHLVPSTTEFLPLEYVYDGAPPKVTATVCPNMLGALAEGSCERAIASPAGTSACSNVMSKSFVCPMHFWGFRRTIERNGAVPDRGAAPALSPSASPPVPGKRPYGSVKAMLFAAADRTFLYAPPESLAAERDALDKALKALCAVTSVSSWDDWRQAATNKPNLLMLIPHTDQFQSVSVLEIGNGDLLGRPEIDTSLSGAGGQPQLLILLGCSAAGVTEDFQPYPEQFRDAGVSIVLAPVAPIRGADAVPIAKHLAQLLLRHLSRPEPTTFGELLPLVRRELLRQGHPGVIGIVGFGDGDWLLGGR